MVSLLPQCCTNPTSSTLNIVPLVPLVWSLDVWLTLGNLSRWLLRTVWLSYAIQSARHPPQAPFFLPQYEARMLLSLLWAETTVLPAKYAVEPVPPAEMKTGCIPVQGPFLRVVPVTSQLYQSCRGCPCPIEGSRHSHPQLSRRLAIFNSLLRGTWSSST